MQPHTKMKDTFLKQLAILTLLTVAVLATTPTTSHAQCYTDPFTGQRICTSPAGNCPAGSSCAKANVVSVDSAAHCRIRVADGTLGSGSLIGSDQSIGLVLTCAHLFSDSPSQVVVSFPNAGQFSARLVDIDRANDLAALVIQRPSLSPLPVASDEPAGQLVACGYGSNNLFRAIQGAMTGRAVAVGATHPSITIAGAVRSGDSGGAVLNCRGQLCGVVWGQRDGQTYATCGLPVCDFLNRVRGRVFAKEQTSNHSPPPSPQLDLSAWTNDIDARLQALDAKKQDRGDYLQHGDLNGYLRTDDATKLTAPLAERSEVESKLTTLATRFDSIHAVVDTVQQHITEISSDREGILRGLSFGKLIAGAIGLCGPLAAAVVIAGGLAGRRIKSRLRRLESHVNLPALDTRPSTLDRAIAIDTPPPPQRSVPETHYVPIEKDSFAKAHQWASEHVARKYPGASEVLQAQESLIKQFMAAK